MKTFIQYINESEDYFGGSLLVQSYLASAVWAEIDGTEYSYEDMSDESVEQAKADVAAFMTKAKGLLGDTEESKIAHDFWLTRNGHGAGFWDGDYEHGDELTKIAEEFGSLSLIVGDDGKLYIE